MTEGIKAVKTEPTKNEGESAPSGALLQVKGLTICTRAGESLLSDISFHIEPGELVALTGVGQSNKSILLQSLAGLLPPAGGEILIDGVNLYTNLNNFRSSIGFVPAEFALHQNLTTAEVLQGEARLRLPRRTASEERKQQALTLLETVGLTQVTNRQVGSLSNVEKRKLSIAVELICYPPLLLVDESAEPLTPFDELEITILLRELSRRGRTIIQVNARSRGAGISDKIIFLAPGGMLAWFGPADEAFNYLKGFIPRVVVKDLFGLQEALEMLVNPQVREGVEWAKRFKDHTAYQKYIDDPLQNRYPDLLLQTRPLLRLRLRNATKEKLPPPIIPRANSLQKLILLIRRNSRLLWRDRTGPLMLVIPLLIALVNFIISPERGDSSFPAIVPDLFIFLVVITAALLVHNEIIKERTVYRREQRTSSLLFPYILSKLWLIGLLAIYQGSIWLVVHFLGRQLTGIAGELQTLLPYGLTLGLVAFIGGVLGLMISAVSRTALTTTGWVLLLTLSQLLFLLNPLSHWSRLVIVGLCLVVVLVGIQQRTGSVRT